MSNSFAPAPSPVETGYACVRNYIKAAVPVKLPIGAHTCYGKTELGFNCASRCCGQWMLCLLRWWFLYHGHFWALMKKTKGLFVCFARQQCILQTSSVKKKKKSKNDYEGV